MSFRIESVFAFLSVDESDEEGIIAELNPATGMWFPLISADQRRFEDYKVMAQRICDRTGMPVRIARFDYRIDEGTMLPNPFRRTSDSN